MTAKLIASMKDAPAAARVDTLSLLARRGDPSALKTALDAMKDEDVSVRKAAIKAAAAVGKEEAIPALLAALNSKDRGEVETARSALTLIPGEKATAAMVAALETTPPQVRRELLGILAGRGARAHIAALFARTKDEDESVRVAAIGAIGVLGQDPAMAQLLELLVGAKSGGERNAAERAADAICRRSHRDRCAAALLDALPKAELDARCAILRVLGGCGSTKGLAPIRAGIKDADPKVQEAALRGLTRWPDASVAEELLGIAKSAKEQTRRVLALQGYIRLVKLPSKRSNRETIDMYSAAMAAAERPQEKKSILGAVAEIAHMGGLKMALDQLADKEVRAEAEVAIIRLSERLHRIKDPEARKTIAGALMKVIMESDDKRRQKDARRFHDRWYKKK
jgi:HEAT repeat protein